MHALPTDLALVVFVGLIASVRLGSLRRPVMPRIHLRTSRPRGIVGRTVRPTALVGVGLAVGLAGSGAYATFTSVASQSPTIGTGTVTVGLGTTGTSADRLDIGASGIVAGDTMQRSLDVNIGTADLGSISLTTTASPSSLLDSDTSNGLQMVIDKCSVAWTEGGTAPAYTYSCSGSTSTVIASRPVIGSSVGMSNMTLTAGSANHLRVTLTLPSTSSNSTQGLSSTITYSFTGTQRSATNK